VTRADAPQQQRTDSAAQSARAVVSSHAQVFDSPTARAKNRRFLLLSALRTHTKTPYKTD
jgi:hypothetical protein